MRFSPAYCLPLLLLLPSLALAQRSASTADLLARQDEDRWMIGVGASIKDEGYAGMGTRVRPFPLLAYEGKRVFWRGLSGGVHAYRGEHFSVDAVLSGRFDGFDADDLGRRELAARGIDIDLLEDRDDALDAGVSLGWRTGASELKLTALHDVTDTSGGQEIALDYAYALHWGRTTLVPGIGVHWLSRDTVDYYTARWTRRSRAAWSLTGPMRPPCRRPASASRARWAARGRWRPSMPRWTGWRTAFACSRSSWPPPRTS